MRPSKYGGPFLPHSRIISPPTITTSTIDARQKFTPKVQISRRSFASRNLVQCLQNLSCIANLWFMLADVTIQGVLGLFVFRYFSGVNFGARRLWTW